MRTAEIDKRLGVLAEEAAQLRQQRDENTRRRTLKCGDDPTPRGCGKRFQIRRLTYLQTHWYREPYGCTGGAHWNSGEGQWKCPSCGYVNREFYNNGLSRLKRFFEKVEDIYD